MFEVLSQIPPWYICQRFPSWTPGRGPGPSPVGVPSKFYPSLCLLGSPANPRKIPNNSQNSHKIAKIPKQIACDFYITLKNDTKSNHSWKPAIQFDMCSPLRRQLKHYRRSELWGWQKCWKRRSILDLDGPFLHLSFYCLNCWDAILSQNCFEDLYKTYTIFSSLVFILPWTWKISYIFPSPHSYSWHLDFTKRPFSAWTM